MKLVLLSGGSGKRLWPLSNDSRSKQFLKVLPGENGENESMVQRVWRQLSSAGLKDCACVATNKAQVDLIQNQLGPRADLVIEPEQRDTFPAIALAATYLYSFKNARLDEAVAVLPVDPYVQDDFFQKVKEMEQVLERTNADFVLMGVKPTYPSEKYGYIVPDPINEAEFSPYMKVSHFQEKPDEDAARSLIERRALWNCGIFAFRLGHIINLLIEMKLPIQYEEMLKQYGQLNKRSFDYEVIEKATNMAVLPYEGEWKDLGTWNTLTEEMGNTVTGFGKVERTSNTHLINELQLPVVVLGVSNAVVAATPDGILVTDKANSPRVKEVMQDLKERPMYEERRWGSYRVIDFADFGKGQKVLTKRLCVHAGQNLSYQYHHKRSEVWTIISGTGVFVLNEQFRHVQPGDVLKIPAGARHTLKAIQNVEMIEVQRGSDLIEEDIVRLQMNWEEISVLDESFI